MSEDEFARASEAIERCKASPDAARWASDTEGLRATASGFAAPTDKVVTVSYVAMSDAGQWVTDEDRRPRGYLTIREIQEAMHRE